MLKEAMLALRVTDPEYTYQIRDLLEAAVIDLQMAGIQISGEVDITIAENEQTGEITYTDSSTITDKAVMTAMITYVRVHFGSPADYERVAASYDLQRRQLANATGYTDFLNAEPTPEPEPEPETAEAEAEP